jgi:hypothetical protein
VVFGKGLFVCHGVLSLMGPEPLVVRCCRSFQQVHVQCRSTQLFLERP